MDTMAAFGEEDVLTPFHRAQMDAFYATVDEDLAEEERRSAGKGVRHG